MPIEFLTEEHRNHYGKFHGEPNEIQLARYFHLDDSDKTLINERRRDYNRLGFGLQLSTVRFLGTFLTDPTDVPLGVISFIAKQIGINDVTSLHKYLERKQTRYAHCIEIQQRYGYVEFNTSPWKFRLIRLLYERAWLNNERPTLMFDFATAWLVRNKVLLPGVTTLSRLISEIRDRASKRLWQKLSKLPSDTQKHKLETILGLVEDKRFSKFDRLRQGPVRISGPSFNTAIQRYRDLADFGIQKLDFKDIPPGRLRNLSRYAGMASMHKIARMPEDRRIATLVAFVHDYEIIALDDALDVLDLLITDIIGEAKKIGQKKRLRTLKDLDRAALALAEVCAIVLSDDYDANGLRDVIFSKVSKESISQHIGVVNELAREPDDNFHEEMLEQYKRTRRFFPTLLKHIEFKGAPAAKTLLEAIEYLRALEGNNQLNFEEPPLDIVTKSWKRLIVDKEGLVNKKGYTLCVLEQIQDKLKRRDIYVEASNRWGDPRKKLLQGSEWEAKKNQVCRSLGHSLKADETIKNLSEQLDAAYSLAATNFDANDKVRIEYKGDIPTLTITNLEALDEPNSLVQLRKKVEKFLPRVDLTELVLEIHAQTGFADEFTHVSESNARASDLPVSICAVLLSEACNIGLEPLIKQNIPALTRHRLNWVQQNYIREETLRGANIRLVNHQSKIPLANLWGGGEVASADGLRFVTPVRNLNSSYNKKYFGSNKGITWYNFISDQYSGFHGIVVPGTLRDSIFVLEGLLEQQTGLNPSEIMVDTSGASDLIFGLFWIIGYQFSPRLADAGESVFWRIDTEADYGALNELARGRIKVDRIERHWEDMLRIGGSLKFGTVQASELVRSLLRSDRPSSLTQSIIEVGRINKTIYLLNYIGDEGYRRHILRQLNRGEGRHVVARIICHGQRGEIHKRYREGQEDQLGALGLITNAVTLWNTIYMESALNHMKQKGFEVKEEDVARLSPLKHQHINVLGQYSFKLDDPIAKGHLRPLNMSNQEGDL